MQTEQSIKTESRTFMVLDRTDATRKYPFARETLDKIKDLCEVKSDQYYAKTGQDVVVPAPIIIKDAIDLLHEQTFGANK